VNIFVSANVEASSGRDTLMPLTAECVPADASAPNENRKMTNLRLQNAARVPGKPIDATMVVFRQRAPPSNIQKDVFDEWGQWQSRSGGSWFRYAPK